MNIVFVNRYFHPDHSATSQMLSDLAFFLSRQGHAVSVVTSRQRYDDPAALLPPEETIGGVRVVRVATTRFGRDNLAGRAFDYATFYTSAARALRGMIGHDGIVVAKTDPPLIAVAVERVVRRRGARLVNWVQDLFPEVGEALGVPALKGPQTAVLRRLRDRALRTAAASVVVGERMKDRVVAAGAPPERVHVICNWADTSAIRPIASADNALRQAWALERTFVACYSGNMGRAHEFGTIVDAAAIVGSDVRFVFIGGGPQRRAVETSAQTRGVTNLEFRPYQPREGLSQSLSVGDVHLLSLRPELEGCIFPSKLYGILAAGRPAIFIGDPEGEIARLIERERVGFAVAQGDGRALAQRLQQLANDPALTQQMGSRARVLSARYDVTRAVDAWERMLETLAR